MKSISTFWFEGCLDQKPTFLQSVLTGTEFDRKKNVIGLYKFLDGSIPSSSFDSVYVQGSCARQEVINLSNKQHFDNDFILIVGFVR